MDANRNTYKEIIDKKIQQQRISKNENISINKHFFFIFCTSEKKLETYDHMRLYISHQIAPNFESDFI